MCDLFLSSLAKRLKQREITLAVSAAAKEELVREGYDEVYGARPLKRVIQRRIEDALSEEILQSKVATGQAVNVDVQGGKFVFSPVK